MPRLPRRQSEAGYYHVYSRGNGRQLIYEDDRDRKTFLKMLKDALAHTSTTLHAYCLMGNHYHLIVEQPDFEKLPAFGYELNRPYATYFNERHDRVGHLFQGRYSSQPINDDAYFLAAIRYVHRNPVEAHMTRTCDYRWSSYGDYLAGAGIASTEKALDMLGGIEAFAEFHSHPGKERFADDRPLRIRLTESEALAIARTALGGADPSGLKALPKPDRNESLHVLLAAGLNVSQIALLTGIPRTTVQRVA